MVTIPAETVRSPRVPVPPLENGDQLSAHEFLRRYEAMPGVKKAELINGIGLCGFSGPHHPARRS